MLLDVRGRNTTGCNVDLFNQSLLNALLLISEAIELYETDLTPRERLSLKRVLNHYGI
jgi:hypothetical protein